MRTEIAALILGLGMELIFLVLGVWVVAIPDWVIYGGLTGGGILFRRQLALRSVVLFWRFVQVAREPVSDSQETTLGAL